MQRCSIFLWTFWWCFLRASIAQELPDPGDDGWYSESLSEDVKEQLGELIQHTLDGHPLDKFITEDSQAVSLLPEALSVIREDKQILMERLKKVQGANAPFKESFPVLLGASNRVKGLFEDYHYKVKVSRIEVEKQGVKARVIFHAAGSLPDGNLQLNGIWNTQWEIVAESGVLLLRSLDLVSYDRTILKSAKSWFSDKTNVVLGGDLIFQRQLSLGANHWLNGIERYAGSNIYSRHGMAMGDSNGDGLDDIYLCQPGGLPNRLFLQQKDGSLRDHSRLAKVDWLNDTRSALFLDLDNDGDQDLVLGTFVGCFLCRNDGSGAYEAVAQLPGVGRDISSLVAADYDRDGYVDVYVCVYESEARLEGRDRSGRSVYDLRAKGGVNRLYRNCIGEGKGEWDFLDVTKQAGLEAGNARFTLAAAWEDFDDDGDQDLYLANDFGLNCLYRNQGGKFTEVSEQFGVQDYSPGMSATWGDINRDGKFDLYVGNMFSSAGNRVTRQAKFRFDYEGVTLDRMIRFNRGNSLYLNRGDKFEEKEDAMGAQNALWAWSSILGDIDNDGWEDALCVNGYITGQGPGDL